MEDDVRDQLTRYVRETRDNGRPQLYEVAEILQTLFNRMNKNLSVKDNSFKVIEAGPDRWEWVDTVGGAGQEKYFVLARSANEECMGHPLLTIRQCVAEHLDSWLVTSALILGPDKTTITMSLTVAVTNHAGAYAGFQSTVAATLGPGGIAAGADHAEKLAHRAHKAIDDLGSDEELLDIAHEWDKKKPQNPLN